MNTEELYYSLVNNGDINSIRNESMNIVNRVMGYLHNPSLTSEEIKDIEYILMISNVLYNNTDMDILLLDDGVYDLLLEKFKSVNPNFQVGAIPTVNILNNETMENREKKLINPIKRLDKEGTKDFLYTDIMKNTYVTPGNRSGLISPIKRNQGYLSKRMVNIKHNYPNLVGTLDKCKFVMNYQAEEKGVINDANVKIFERDFIMPLINNGIISPHNISGEMSLKYDGISIESDVTNMIVGARTRGDAVNDIAADVTPILYGYEFPNAPLELWNKEPFGMKFEAIMTYPDLAIFNMLTGNNYKNPRTAIIGLFGRSDGYLYRDLITLVPLQTSLDMSREEEVIFMNKYYASKILFTYTNISGDLASFLFQVKRFTEEAEYMRHFIPFMYDGVVFNFTDENLRKKLGRVNAVNKFAMAIKFTPLKRLTTFRGYQYTVGQYGTVTPMIYYDPVEFYGAIHNHSTGSSYERFKNLNLRVGDIIEVEYTNDVMPYVTKPDNTANEQNPNPPVQFIENCPYCGTKLEFTDSNKNMYCPNIECPQRNLKRMVNMMSKLNMKDFGEARLEQMQVRSLYELFSLQYDDVKFMGNVMANKFLDRIFELKTKPIMDYDILGSLGFEYLGKRKWKLILAHYTINELASMDDETLRLSLSNIKGVGPLTVNTIIDEREFFKNDINVILAMRNIIPSKGVSSGKRIRFTGFRDKSIVQQISDMGHDIDDSAGVTKNTDILLVPEEGFTSTKTAKAIKYNNSGANIQIIPVNDFLANLDKYLN